jgi:hypothetical protein
MLRLLVIALFILPLSLRAQSYLTTAQADVARLASPEFHGRGYEHDGHLLAARYVRDRFRAIGLDSAGPWLQPFPLRTRIVTGVPRLVVDGRPLRLGIDFVPSINGASGASDAPLGLVRAGDGVVIPSRGIDPYRDAEMRDRVAVIDGNVSESVKGDTSIPRAILSNEVRIAFAAEAGARAVILLVDRPTYGEVGDTAAVPVFFVRRDALPEAGKAAGFSLMTGDTIVESNNVVGYLPGTGRPDSTIIICAHYDHIGSIGDSVYFPGANDNASGTAMLLALARSLREKPLRYSVLFLAFGGEEAGLYGSRYYVDHPRLPLGRTRFLLNLDMTASGNDGVMALGGVDFPEEFALLKRIDDSLGLGDLRKRANAPNSDQYFFLAAGIHGFYLYPFTGLQPYHHVNDRPGTLEWNVFEKIYRLSTALLRRIGG